MCIATYVNDEGTGCRRGLPGSGNSLCLCDLLGCARFLLGILVAYNHLWIALSRGQAKHSVLGGAALVEALLRSLATPTTDRPIARAR